MDKRPGIKPKDTTPDTTQYMTPPSCIIAIELMWIMIKKKVIAFEREYCSKPMIPELYTRFNLLRHKTDHYGDVIMGAIASQITSLTIVYSTVYLDADQRKHQSSASLAFVWGIHRGPVNSPHKWPVTRKMFPFDDVIMDTDGHRVVTESIVIK